MIATNADLMLFCTALTILIQARYFSSNLALESQFPDMADASDPIMVLENEFQKRITKTFDCTTKVTSFNQYNALKTLISLMNDLVGSCLTVFVALVSISMSISLNHVFRLSGTRGPWDHSVIGRWIFYNLKHVFILILVADVFRQVHDILFNKWYHNN